jgi:hypothetical protein
MILVLLEINSNHRTINTHMNRITSMSTKCCKENAKVNETVSLELGLGHFRLGGREDPPMTSKAESPVPVWQRA